MSGNEAKVADAVSVFGSETVRADAKAFAALMHHLKAVDEAHSTVVMVQVENEAGLLGDSRDRSRLAEEVWLRSVPIDLIQVLQDSWPKLNEHVKTNFSQLETIDASTLKSWADVPGAKLMVEELFMAYHFAKYVEQVAAAGKAEYDLPLYTNVWQNYWDESKDENISNVVAGGGKPGDYPSGGGVTNVLDIWKSFAPSLSVIAPDIYLNDYAASCAAYRHRNNALLIPEQRRDEYGARRIWAAYGSYKAIGVAPFGIDSVALEDNPFRHHYGLLSRVAKYVLDAQAGRYQTVGFFFDELNADGTDPSPALQFDFNSWRATIERSHVFGTPSAGSGMVIQLSQNEFLLVGWGFQVSWQSKSHNVCFSGLLRFEEKETDEGGELLTLRLLNGDETRSGKYAVMPSCDPDYGGFPISITIPAHTGIAVCEPYALQNQ